MKWRWGNSEHSHGSSTGQDQANGQRATVDSANPDGPDGAQATDTVRMTAWVAGYVQGVGFRWWTRSRALELGLVGTATNLYDGRVEVVVEGPQQACEALLGKLRGANTPGGVDTVTYQLSEARGGLPRVQRAMTSRRVTCVTAPTCRPLPRLSGRRSPVRPHPPGSVTCTPPCPAEGG